MQLFKTSYFPYKLFNCPETSGLLLNRKISLAKNNLSPYPLQRKTYQAFFAASSFHYWGLFRYLRLVLASYNRTLPDLTRGNLSGVRYIFTDQPHTHTLSQSRPSLSRKRPRRPGNLRTTLITDHRIISTFLRSLNFLTHIGITNSHQSIRSLLFLSMSSNFRSSIITR